MVARKVGSKRHRTALEGKTSREGFRSIGNRDVVVSKVTENKSAPFAQSDAIKQYWLGLAAEAKLKALRLEDHRIATMLHSSMVSLLASELLCYRQGVVQRTKTCHAAMSLLLEGFEILKEPDPAGGLRPGVFVAKIIFVESLNFFNLVEEELGASRADASLAANCQRWFEIVRVTPSSWHKLLKQVLQLVDILVLRAYLESVRCNESSCSTTLCELEKADFSSKKVSAGQLDPEDRSLSTSIPQQQVCPVTNDSCSGQCLETASVVSDTSTEDGSSRSRGCSDSMSEKASDECVNKVGLASCEGVEYRTTWLHRGLRSGEAEWRLVVCEFSSDGCEGSQRSPRCIRAAPTDFAVSIKNTFLVETMPRPQAPPRARSLDLPRRIS